MEGIKVLVENIVEELYLGDSQGGALGAKGNWYGGHAFKTNEGLFYTSSYISSFDKVVEEASPITKEDYEKIVRVLKWIEKKDKLNRLCEERIKPLMKCEFKILKEYTANHNLMPYGMKWLAVRREIRKNGFYKAKKAMPICDFSGPSWSHTTDYVPSAEITITFK